jgi:RNA polymerase sigma-70 factor (ECF subfamily)
MRAIALSILGWGPDAEDVVQDAVLAALSRLRDLRDPMAAGAWLRAITRNTARMRLRSTRRETSIAPPIAALPARDPTPEEVIDDHALRDWVWSALETLSEPLQEVVLLRYFTPASSYDQIAAVCDVPVGTVRSRLNQARMKLDQALRATANTAHADIDTLVTRRRDEAEALLSSAPRGQFRTVLADTTVPDLRLTSPQGQRVVGRESLADIMDSDLRAGVRQRLNTVTAGQRITILECDLLSPPSNPQHCPPAVLWLMTLRAQRIERIRLFHPPPARTGPGRTFPDSPTAYAAEAALSVLPGQTCT